MEDSKSAPLSCRFAEPDCKVKRDGFLASMSSAPSTRTAPLVSATTCKPLSAARGGGVILTSESGRTPSKLPSSSLSWDMPPGGVLKRSPVCTTSPRFTGRDIPWASMMTVPGCANRTVASVAANAEDARLAPSNVRLPMKRRFMSGLLQVSELSWLNGRSDFWRNRCGRCY